MKVLGKRVSGLPELAPPSSKVVASADALPLAANHSRSFSGVILCSLIMSRVSGSTPTSLARLATVTERGCMNSI